jgi:hypothetical protein
MHGVKSAEYEDICKRDRIREASNPKLVATSIARKHLL